MLRKRLSFIEVFLITKKKLEKARKIRKHARPAKRSKKNIIEAYWVERLATFPIFEAIS